MFLGFLLLKFNTSPITSSNVGIRRNSHRLCLDISPERHQIFRTGAKKSLLHCLLICDGETVSMNPAGLFSSSFDSFKKLASQLTDWPGGDRTKPSSAIRGRPEQRAFRIALQSTCWKFGILLNQTGRRGHNSHSKILFPFKKLPDWDERE